MPRRFARNSCSAVPERRRKAETGRDWDKGRVRGGRRSILRPSAARSLSRWAHPSTAPLRRRRFSPTISARPRRSGRMLRCREVPGYGRRQDPARRTADAEDPEAAQGRSCHCVPDDGQGDTARRQRDYRVHGTSHPQRDADLGASPQAFSTTASRNVEQHLTPGVGEPSGIVRVGEMGIGQGRRNIHSTVATMRVSPARHLMGA